MMFDTIILLTGPTEQAALVPVLQRLVPVSILRATGHGAFNSHPGPPDYPGWAPAHFALYARAGQFGVTFHVMHASVDSGPILDVDLFPITPDMPVLALKETAYGHLAKMFWRWAQPLTNQAAPLAPRLPMHWGDKKNSRRSYQGLCRIPLDITKEDLDRRMSVFGSNHFGIAPSINLHGVEFRAVVPAD